MNTTILTPTEAVTEFFAIRGDEGLMDWEVEEAVAEIGNPDANLHVVKTNEDADDYRRNGWQDHSQENGITILRKQTGSRMTKRGSRPVHTFVNIADCGDYRLVLVERP